MKPLFAFSALLALASAAAVGPRDEKVSYEGYRVVRVFTDDSAEIKAALAPFADSVWNREQAGHVDLALAPSQLQAFDALGLKTEVMHEDLGKDIAEETAGVEMLAKRAVDDTWFNTYHSYADHVQYVKDLQAAFPSRSEVVTSGSSYQGRVITGIHFWGSGGKGSKPAIIFHGTVHAREWITTMTVEYIAWTLLKGYGSDSTITNILNNYDFYVFPVVNPDGFVYSQTSDRLWRKNRQPPPRGTCQGRDINRNWPYQWDSNPNGASTNPCDQTYKGVSPGDAPENQGLVNYMNGLRDSKGIKLYIDFHSYGQYMLSPYGYDCNRLVANNAKHQSLAQGTTNAIRQRYGTAYTYGPSCSTLYATTGSSNDYAYDVAKTELTYTLELRDKGNYGFVLPASQIRPTAQETWDGLRYLLTSF